jgi:thiol-disulfide isomerase/thioredoxin
LRIEEFQFCPRCGAALDQGAGVSPEPVPGVVTCGACGATFHPADVGVVVPPPGTRGNRNPLALVVVALVAAGMLYFGMHMSRRSGPGPGATMNPSDAPDFTLESLDGKSMRLSDLRGKAVLLNFWATWCGPCKIETPWLVELQNQYGHDGLQIVGVEMGDDSKDEITKFTKDMAVNYPILIGKEAVGDAYGGVPALPETFFIGRDGKIVNKIIGLKGKGEIEDSIKKALDTPAGSTQAALTSAALRTQGLQAQK